MQQGVVHNSFGAIWGVVLEKPSERCWLRVGTVSQNEKGLSVPATYRKSTSLFRPGPPGRTLPLAAVRGDSGDLSASRLWQAAAGSKAQRGVVRLDRQRRRGRGAVSGVPHTHQAKTLVMALLPAVSVEKCWEAFSAAASDTPQRGRACPSGALAPGAGHWETRSPGAAPGAARSARLESRCGLERPTS